MPSTLPRIAGSEKKKSDERRIRDHLRIDPAETHLILFKSGHVAGVGVAQTGEDGLGVSLAVREHDPSQAVADSPSGHGRELTRQSGDGHVPYHRQLRLHHLGLPRVRPRHLQAIGTGAICATTSIGLFGKSCETSGPSKRRYNVITF